MNGSFAVAAANFGEGSADVALESADIEPYLIMNAVGLPQLGGGMALKANAKVAVDGQKIALSSIGGQAGGNPFSGNLAFQRAAPYPVTGDLAVRTADLAWLGDAIYGPVIDPETGALNAKPLAMAAFPQLKASLALKAESFEAGPFGTVTGVSAQVTHDAGGLSLDDVAGTFMGGKLTGRLAMSTGEGAGIFRTKIAVTDANPEPILWANANGPVAAGRVAIDLTAESTGKSVGEMLKSAGGSGEIRAGGLVLKGLNPGTLPPILQAADGLQQPIDAPKVRPLVDQSLWQGEIGLGDVALPFSLNGGALHFKNLRAGIDPVTLTADATVDLAASTVNGDLDLLFNPGTETVAGAEPSVRLNYNGPLAAPALTTDVSALSNYLSLRAFEKERRRVEAMQASVLEKQRLRREVALYRSQAAERQAEKERVEAEAKAKAEEEARLKAAAEERLRQEKEQQERLQQQQQQQEQGQQPTPERQSAPVLVVPPTENAIRQLAPENAPATP